MEASGYVCYSCGWFCVNGVDVASCSHGGAPLCGDKVYVMYVFHGVAVAVVGVLWQQAWRQRDLHDIQHPSLGTLAWPSERLLVV